MVSINKVSACTCCNSQVFWKKNWNINRGVILRVVTLLTWSELCWKLPCCHFSHKEVSPSLSLSSLLSPLSSLSLSLSLSLWIAMHLPVDFFQPQAAIGYSHWRCSQLIEEKRTTDKNTSDLLPISDLLDKYTSKSCCRLYTKAAPLSQPSHCTNSVATKPVCLCLYTITQRCVHTIYVKGNVDFVDLLFFRIYFYLRHERVTKKDDNNSLQRFGVLHLLQREIVKRIRSWQVSYGSFSLFLSEEGVTRRNVGDYYCHLFSSSVRVSNKNLSWNMRMRCKKSLAKLTLLQSCREVCYSPFLMLPAGRHPHDLPALSMYAMVLERQGLLQQAEKAYRRWATVFFFYCFFFMSEYFFLCLEKKIIHSIRIVHDFSHNDQLPTQTTSSVLVALNKNVEEQRLSGFVSPSCTCSACQVASVSPPSEPSALRDIQAGHARVLR